MIDKFEDYPTGEGTLFTPKIRLFTCPPPSLPLSLLTHSRLAADHGRRSDAFPAHQSRPGAAGQNAWTRRCDR